MLGPIGCYAEAYSEWPELLTICRRLPKPSNCENDEIAAGDLGNFCNIPHNLRKNL